MPIIKKSSLFVVGVILVIALVTTPLIGCGSEGAGQEATESEDIYSDADFVLNKAILSSALDGNGLPVNSTNVFTSDTEEIFCTIWAVIPDICCTDVTVTVIWLYLGEQIGYWQEEATHIAWPANVSITRPENGFSKGDYRVAIYLGIQEVISLPFTVE